VRSKPLRFSGRGGTADALSEALLILNPLIISPVPNTRPRVSHTASWLGSFRLAHISSCLARSRGSDERGISLLVVISIPPG
jgi:hypothetical protein